MVYKTKLLVGVPSLTPIPIDMEIHFFIFHAQCVYQEENVLALVF